MSKAHAVCNVPGCHYIAVTAGRCATHASQVQQRYDAQRASPSARGYDAAWRKARAAYLAEQPGCQWLGCRSMATDVHHRVPLVQGGTHDADNLVALCHAHHSSITAHARPRPQVRA